MPAASNNTLHTLYGPYRTPDAISRAADSDFIPLDGGNNINAVHPIPVEWLQHELLPHQRDCVREHVAAQLNSTRPVVADYLEALQTTISNLNTVRNAGSVIRRTPSRQQSRDDIDSLTDRLDNMTTDEFGDQRSPRNVRFAEAVRSNRIHRYVPGPHSPSPRRATPSRSSMRTPGHTRTNSASSTMTFATSTEHNVRDASPTAVRLNELIAMNIQLDEFQSSVNREARLNDPRVTDRRNSDIEEARATLRRLQELRHITFEDVENGRAAISSVGSAAYRDMHPPGPDRGRRQNSTSSTIRDSSSSPEEDFMDNPYAYVAPHNGRRSSTPHPATGNLDHSGPPVWLTDRQDLQRRTAIALEMFPVWNDIPISPYLGDGYVEPSGEIFRLNREEKWRVYNGRRQPYFCD